MTSPLDSSYREIDLGNGRVAIVDAKNFDRLNKHNWYAWWCKNVQNFYAVRHEPKPGGGQRTVYMHREVLGLKYGDSRRADHRNPELTLVNTIKNLRRANYSESQMNRRGRRTTPKGYKDIRVIPSETRGQRFVVRVKVLIDGKKVERGGTRNTLYEAQELRSLLLKRLHGKFANLD